MGNSAMEKNEMKKAYQLTAQENKTDKPMHGQWNQDVD